MKKKFLLLSATLSVCAALSSLVLFSFKNEAFAIQGAGDYYSITIKPEDITTSTTEVSGSFVAYTDQLNNPVTFNYENISYQEDGENKYIVLGQGAWLGNDKNSQIRKIENFTIFGDNTAFSFDYDWSTKLGSIVYTGLDHSGLANGSNISLDNNQPNYFVLMYRNSNVKISKIVFTYSKDCTPGEKPAPVLNSISLSGQTTSLNRGSAFSFGGTVSAHYSDGTVTNVTSKTTFSGYNMSKSGSYTVTATYEGKTATYKLTVNKAWSALWSGNKKIGDGGVTSFTFGSVTYISGLQIRCTFNGMSAWPTSSGDEVSVSYVPNGSSPYTVSTFSSTLTTLLQASIYNTSRRNGCDATVYYNKNTGSIYGQYDCHRPDYCKAKLTVTKIEVYY